MGYERLFLAVVIWQSSYRWIEMRWIELEFEMRKKVIEVETSAFQYLNQKTETETKNLKNIVITIATNINFELRINKLFCYTIDNTPTIIDDQLNLDSKNFTSFIYHWRFSSSFQ